MINKDNFKGFVAGLSVAAVLCSTTVFADSIAKTVTAVYNNIKIVIDGTEITPTDANGNKVEPFIIDGTTYLPVRAVASALGKDVNWDGETNTVYLGEMPVKEEVFALDTETLKSFISTPLITVGNIPVNGGIYNFYITQNALGDYMQYVADNYSPSGNLQTLTVQGVPAAKYFAQEVTANLKSMYAVYEDAEKTGFTKKQENIDKVNASWNDTLAQMGGQEALEVYAMANSVTPSDLEDMIKKSIFANNYVNSILEAKSAEKIDVLGFEADFRKNYITAKHILVAEEALAKEIIAKLDKGADFNALMKEHNTDPGATEDGYTFTYGEMVAPFETAAFTLKENTYTSVPVKTDYGYHIVYRCPLNEKALSEAVENHKFSKANEATQKFITDIENSANVTYTADYEKYITTIK